LLVEALNYVIEEVFYTNCLTVVIGAVTSLPRSGAKTTLIKNFAILEFEVFALIAKFYS